ncbi:MAG: putative manganese-dependent inorganic diphosphatase, partial [Opitutales bacterium]
MQNAKPTLIIGHKNPDADAICSALAYAAFKRQSGAEGQFQAARCGNSNARIDAILRRFEVPLPPLVTDVTPRVQDMLHEKVIKTHADATCGEALELIDQHDVRALPVVDSDNRLQGIVSIFSLGEFFIPKPAEPRMMRRVHTRISDIVRVLRAQPMHLEEPDRLEELYVRVGAMDIRSFGRFTEKEGIKPEQSIIVVGDRYDIQQKAIQAGARVLVITGNLEIDEDVVKLCQERRVCLIISPWDSATTSWMIRSATRLEPMIDRETFTVGPEEKIAQVRRRIAHNYSPLYCVVDEQQHLLGVFSKTDLLRSHSRPIILVDHNELNQAVNGAAECEIVEIIDHHRLGNVATAQPIRFRNEVIGSTCSIVASMFQEKGLEPDPEIAGIMMAGLISDTLFLQGPTTTPRDGELLEWLKPLVGVEPKEIADLIFQSGSVVLNSSPAEIITSDQKHYDQSGIRFAVSQVEELGFSNFWDR